jgi:hypothetical protein
MNKHNKSSKKITSTEIKHGNKFYTPEVIGRNTLSTPAAISELVANSFDWCITKHDSSKKTVLKIYVTPESLTIVDNGVGMTLEQLSVAKDFARAQEKYNKRNEIVNDEDRKGMYGMGMKVSALTLGWKYTIVTKSINDPNIQHVFEFDSSNLKDEKSDYLSNLKIISVEGPYEGFLINEYSSGTFLRIEKLTDKGKVPSVSTLKDELTQYFWPQIENLQSQDKLEFKIIDGHTESAANTYLAANIVRPAFEHEILKLDFEKPKFGKKNNYSYIGSDGQTHQLKGFIQLLKKRDFGNGGNYGINIYVKNQLVTMFEKELFGISGRTYEKIYGEIDLTGAVAGNVKNAIQEDSGFKNVVELITEDLQGIYKKLGTPTRKANDWIVEEIQRRLNNSMPETEEPGEKKDKAKENKTSEAGGESVIIPEGMPDNVVKITDTIYYHICKRPDVFNNLEFAWKALSVSSEMEFDNCQLFELHVRVNTNSAFFKALKDQMHGRDLNTVQNFFNKVAICESLLDIIREKHSVRNPRAIIDKNVYPTVIKMKL